MVRTVQRRLVDWPAYPLILAVYPVLLVYSANLTEGIEPSELLLPVAVALLATAVVYAALWLTLGSARQAALATTAIVIPGMLFASIVEAIDPLWTVPSIVRSQLIALLACVVIALLGVALAARTRRGLAWTTETMYVMAVALLVLAAVPILRYELWPTDVRALGSASVTTQPVDSAAVADRDIYHFVFDRYGSESALQTGLDIDNSEFTAWLREQGFQVVDDSRANYWRTLPSLGSMFRMSLLDDVALEMGSDNPNPDPLHDLLRNNPAAATLQELGYTYVHLGAWYREFTRSDIADYVHLPDYQIDFASTVFDSTALPFMQGLLGIVTGVNGDGASAPRALATLDQVERVESMATVEGPKLVYAHFLVPHRPFQFLEDGTIDPGEATFESQLRFTNQLIHRLVEPLLAKPVAERPIIILQADEGPFPERYDEAGPAFDWSTATDDELLTKFGILNAWYLPGPEGEEPLPAGMTLVNTYPEILDRYLQVEVERSPDRSYVARGGALYDHIDVTQRLDDATQPAGDD